MNIRDKKKSTYQDTRPPEERFELIISAIKDTSVSNLLDIGCNRGYLSEMFHFNMNLFVLGIDREIYWNSPGKDGIILSKLEINNENISKLPEFDIVLMLSVHHQIVKNRGDMYTQKLVKSIFDKCRKYMFIEFSGVNDRYGYKEKRFINNSEDSVVSYAGKWLTNAGFTSFEYIGKTENQTIRKDKEPYRFMFIIEKE